MCPPNYIGVLNIEINTQQLLLEVVGRKKKGFGQGASPGGRAGYIRVGMQRGLIVRAGFFESGNVRWKLTSCGQRVAEFLHERAKLANTELIDDIYNRGICPLEETPEGDYLIGYHDYEHWDEERGDGSSQRQRYYRRNAQKKRRRTLRSEPGQGFLRRFKEPLHDLRTDINTIQRNLTQIGDLVKDIERRTIPRLVESQPRALQQLLYLMMTSDMIERLHEIREELEMLNGKDRTRKIKDTLVDWTHEFNTREIDRKINFDKIRMQAMSHPWDQVYDHIYGIGGEVYFVSDDLVMAGFTIPKDKTEHLNALLDIDPTRYTYSYSDQPIWERTNQPSLIIIKQYQERQGPPPSSPPEPKPRKWRGPRKRPY